MLPHGAPKTLHAKAIHKPHRDFLFERLAHLGVNTVIVEYDGESDSGQINTVEAFAENTIPIDLENTGGFTFQFYEGGGETAFANLSEFIDTLCWDLLELYHDGFEINDGGFGSFRFCVGSKSITLTHNENVVSFTTETLEV